MKNFLWLFLLAGNLFGATIEKNFILLPAPSSMVLAAPRYVQGMNAFGQPLHWDVDKAITVKMDASMPVFAVQATINAMQTWNEQINGVLNFQQVGQYSTDKSELTFVWNLMDIPQDTRLADTSLFSADGIHITSATVTFYALAYNFHTGWPFGASSPFGGISNLPIADIQGVALHECGHVLGLLHSTTVVNGDYPVMYPSITTQSSYLHADDIAGIQATYANALAEASNPDTDQDRMVKLFAEVGVQYTVTMNQKLKKPIAVKNQIFNQIQLTGKNGALFLFNPANKKFRGTVIGGTQFLERQE